MAHDENSPDAEPITPLKPQTKQTAMQQMAPFMNLGMELFAAVAGFGAIGWFIDSKFNTAPLWMIILLFLGAIGGMYNLIRVVIKSSEKPKL